MSLKTREEGVSSHWDWTAVRNVDQEAKKDWKFSAGFPNAEVKETCAKSTEVE